MRELKNQIKQLDDLAAKTEVAASFDEEPICRLIMDRVNEGQFKSKIDYIIYKDSALDKQQLLDLPVISDNLPFVSKRPIQDLPIATLTIVAFICWG